VVAISSRVERIAAHRYTFLSDWTLPVPPNSVFSVLKDLWSYPMWWPEFKRADRIDDETGLFALRSALPITLTFGLRRDVEDEARGLLAATASGDIEGSVEWLLELTDSGTTIAHFTERVTLRHRFARRADFALRPVLNWNHAAAMRSGHDGLISRLATPAR
jgi:hypothetical protein